MIRVATGVIYNDKQEILIALRHKHVHLGGLWEFPGGKIEGQETAEQALIRELQEEIGITPTQIRPCTRVVHTYPDNITVELEAWWVDQFTGQPQGLEGQEIRWVPATLLETLEFPAACKTIVEAVKSFLC
jgi:8-oxo-dGTP diphosphatase